MLQPVIVRPRAAGGYELVAGERRWRAAHLAERSSIPALINDTVDGAVNIADSMSRVVVGNVFIGCAANKIGTRMVLDENTQGIAAINNTVGSLIAYNNSGAVIIISGNHP